jgi:polysaccharide deacetylase 2 family uncharacterized protein YibQ
MQLRSLIFIFFYSLLSSISYAQKPTNLTIVIDDMGNSINDFHAFSLPIEISFSILPFTPRAQQIAKKAQLQGRGLLAHIPMQALANNHRLGEGALMLDMQEQEFKSELQRSLDYLPEVQGINNHMGSLLTTQELHMNWTMEVLKKQGLYFLDSRTTADSIAEQTAEISGIPTLRRDVFLDNIKTVEAMEKQFQRAIKLSKNKISAVIIAHPYPETIQFLQDKFKAPIDGVQLISLNQLIPETQQLAIWQEKAQFQQANNYPTIIEPSTQAQ